MVKGIKNKIRGIETPFYLYDELRIRKNISFLKEVFSEDIFDLYFAVKANDSLAVLKIIHTEGLGAETVSPGEIFLTREIGFKPKRILYNNVAKKRDEVLFSLRKGVIDFNFEAMDQALLIERCAKEMKKKPRLYVRINPGIIPGTHTHLATGSPLSKFGIELGDLRKIISTVKKFQFSRLVGIHSHIGSQILTPSSFIKAAKSVSRVIEVLIASGISIDCVNLGGGFGIPYRHEEKDLDLKPVGRAYRELAKRYGVRILLEPGRFIVGNAGYIVTKVLSVKKRGGVDLYIVDADMNENPRPAMYRAYHHIESLYHRKGKRRKGRVAGPLCENSNEFGTFSLPPLKVNDILIMHNSGAYTRTMGSNYNGRLLSAEYVFKNGRIRKTRSKQRFSDLMQNEKY
jgi:diaminopimelate decarboxylase